MQIKKVGVLGCGLMGSGIAQVCASAGFETYVREVDQKYLDKGFAGIEKSLSKFAEKGKITADQKTEIQNRLHGTTSLDDLKDCDLIIEVVIEDIKIKNEMFSHLDKICGDHTIFASNTSSLTIAEMAAATSRPDKVVGLHFFNPVPLMKLVEVVRSVTTSKETFDIAFEFGKALCKKPIATKDNSGFVVNLLLVPFLLSAIRALETGVASTEDIDKGMMLGCGHPMGPLTLLDFVGIDTTYKIAEIMFQEYKTIEYACPPLLKKMHLAGFHGRKTGKGFYDYTDPRNPVAMDLGI